MLCYHFSKQSFSNLSKIKYLAFFIPFCFVVSLAKMVTLSTNFVYKKSTQYRKYLCCWPDEKFTLSMANITICWNQMATLMTALAVHTVSPKSKRPLAVATRGMGRITKAPIRSTVHRFLISIKFTVLIFNWKKKEILFITMCRNLGDNL